jgi:hypothetical protein
MSAVGHKRTFAVQNRMSALPPIADICSAQALGHSKPRLEGIVLSRLTGQLRRCGRVRSMRGPAATMPVGLIV